MERIFTHLHLTLFLQEYIPKTFCAVRERFLEAILQRTGRELAAPGRPGSVDGLVAEGGAPGGAAPLPKGARGFATWAARGGFVNPASKGCVAHTPGASRRSIALAMVRG